MSRGLRTWRTLVHGTGRLLYWFLPVAILAAILHQVDVSRLVRDLLLLNIWYVIAVLACQPLFVFFGAWRWRYVTGPFVNASLPLGYMVKHYWFGQAVNILAPGTLGWDAYRVIAVGRRTGRYFGAALALLVEKIAGVASIGLFFLALYPWAMGHAVGHQDDLTRIRTGALVILGVAALALGLFSVVRSNRFLSLLTRAGEELAARARISLAPMLQATEAGGGPEARTELRLLGQWRVFATVTILSVPGMFVAALAHHFLFLALRSPIPFTVNLFVVVLLGVVMALPVTFGGIGVREIGYIVLYGFFGVTMETALLAAEASFLTGLLVNLAVAGVMLVERSRERRQGEDVKHEDRSTGA